MKQIANRLRSSAGLYRQRFLGLARDQRGISVVEFALLLPLMVTLYLGVVEISQGISADRKVTNDGTYHRRPGVADGERQ